MKRDSKTKKYCYASSENKSLRIDQNLFNTGYSRFNSKKPIEMTSLDLLLHNCLLRSNYSGISRIKTSMDLLYKIFSIILLESKNIIKKFHFYSSSIQINFELPFTLQCIQIKDREEYNNNYQSEKNDSKIKLDLSKNFDSNYIYALKSSFNIAASEFDGTSSGETTKEIINSFYSGNCDENFTIKANFINEDFFYYNFSKFEPICHISNQWNVLGFFEKSNMFSHNYINVSKQVDDKVLDPSNSFTNLTYKFYARNFNFKQIKCKSCNNSSALAMFNRLNRKVKKIGIKRVKTGNLNIFQLRSKKKKFENNIFYYEINLNSIHSISHIMTLGAIPSYKTVYLVKKNKNKSNKSIKIMKDLSFVTSYRIEYYDNKNWNFLPSIYHGNSRNVDLKSFHTLNIKASKIRIYPINYHFKPNFRLLLFTDNFDKINIIKKKNKVEKTKEKIVINNVEDEEFVEVVDIDKSSNEDFNENFIEDLGFRNFENKISYSDPTLVEIDEFVQNTNNILDPLKYLETISIQKLTKVLIKNKDNIVYMNNKEKSLNSIIYLCIFLYNSKEYKLLIQILIKFSSLYSSSSSNNNSSYKNFKVYFPSSDYNKAYFSYSSHDYYGKRNLEKKNRRNMTNNIFQDLKDM